MKLGTKVGLSTGDTILDGDPAPPTERGTAAPHFSAHVYFGPCLCQRYGPSPISTTAEVLYVYTIRFHNLQYYLPFSTGVRNIYAEIILGLLHMARAYVDMVAYVVRALSVET